MYLCKMFLTLVVLCCAGLCPDVRPPHRDHPAADVLVDLQPVPHREPRPRHTRLCRRAAGGAYHMKQLLN